MSDPVFEALGLQEFEPQLPHPVPRGAQPPSYFNRPHQTDWLGAFEADACLSQACAPAWPGLSNAAVLHAAAMAASLQDHEVKGLAELFAAQDSWTSGAHGMSPAWSVTPGSFAPAYSPDSLASLSQFCQASLTSNGLTATSPSGISDTTFMKSNRNTAFGLSSEDPGMSELDEAVNRLLQSDDGPPRSHRGNWTIDEVPSTPPPHSSNSDMLGGTPAKVTVAARSTSPEPPPGLQQKCRAQEPPSSPVVLQLSSMSFPSKATNSAIENSLFSPLLLPVDGPPSTADFLVRPPGIEDTSTDFETSPGAFLLGLLQGNASSVMEESAAGCLASPAADAPSSPVKSEVTAGRRPTRRGRRAGHTKPIAKNQ